MEWKYEIQLVTANGLRECIAAKQQFNRLGSEGWELVQIVERPRSDSLIAIFKQPIEEVNDDESN